MARTPSIHRKHPSLFSLEKRTWKIRFNPGQANPEPFQVVPLIRTPGLPVRKTRNILFSSRTNKESPPASSKSSFPPLAYDSLSVCEVLLNYGFCYNRQEAAIDLLQGVNYTRVCIVSDARCWKLCSNYIWCWKRANFNKSSFGQMSLSIHKKTSEVSVASGNVTCPMAGYRCYLWSFYVPMVRYLSFDAHFWQQIKCPVIWRSPDKINLAKRGIGRKSQWLGYHYHVNTGRWQPGIAPLFYANFGRVIDADKNRGCYYCFKT